MRAWLGVLVVCLCACGGGAGGGDDAGDPDGGPADAGADVAIDAPSDAAEDAASRDAAPPDAGDANAGPADAGVDARVDCRDEHGAGDRYPAGDGCNFCDCLADGSASCTDRTCVETGPPCEYAGATHAYGERFAATDGENECVCAASGLACTRRSPDLPEEGAILLESLDEPCGDDPTFTGQAVLSGLPSDDLTAPFAYDRARSTYPESRPDTRIRVRVVYDGGFVVCRLPSASQPAIDAEVVVEWMTEDGAFDEALHTYLRRNGFGFVDAWLALGSVPYGGLHGAYDPACLDPGAFSFFAQLNADRTVEGSVGKTCEADIGLDVGTFSTTL